MNNWWRIGVPVLMAVLLITATVGITLAVSARSSAGQAPATLPVQGTSTQYVSAPLCPNCPGYVQPATAGSQDNSTASAYVSQGATCPNCPGYTAASGAQPSATVRGGCCGGR